MDINKLSERFNNFAVIECKGSSPLYEALSLQIAIDTDMLRLSSYASEGQPVPNLFLGAVHYLLHKDKNHPLHEFYPSLVNEPKKPEGAFTEFKDFCEHNRKEIIQILQNKSVQTNEVRRCAYLYPVFCHIYKKIGTPLSLIEIGTSAGLQLMWDQYSYSYGDDKVYGNKDSFLHLTASLREGTTPQMLTNSPPVHSRLGLDLNIVDLNHEEEYLWLKALIWPEHKERLEIFQKAAVQIQHTPPTLVEGDGVELLTKYAEEVSSDSTICIFHTHVANQFPDRLKQKLFNQVKEIGEKRDIFHIYNNMRDRKLHLDYYIKGNEQNEVIGDTDGHGRWFDWNIAMSQEV
ncbi:DUF2332 domain-containing protein [Alkalihalobacillus sp. AL-G]|uniref:DUF2332 domain-containing protein n=1 Tax=Alkalihalobacillus sp. AL-G TaxID=2926399 RepID=UPI00272CCC47|nr:DUF2332 domain-containing protein [Alkalihalobacillus sp. AL-G]WLD91710.1 DUF2332 domain-containing protein [Alkalihalobacillus sp. AL-G]